MKRTSEARAAPIPLAIRAVWGMALLFAPRTVLRVIGGADDSSAAVRIVRVLGARHLLQGAVEARFGSWTLRLGIGVDLLHALTDVGFAGIDSRWRRAASTDAAITTGFAVLGIFGSGSRRIPGRSHGYLSHIKFVPGRS